MKTEFLSNVSHELRTPLTPIQGYADLLRRKGSQLGSERSGAYASIILDSSKRLQRVVELLVDVAALDAGRVQTEPRAVTPTAFADQRLAQWRSRVPERSKDLRRRVATGLRPLWVDPVLLAKAVDELVDNALKYSQPGSAVVLGASPGDTESEIRLWVSDSGEGLPEDSRDRLFGDFEQADGSATRTRPGLGLGLSFVRRLAEVIGARLEVRATPGEGSTFTLVLPAAPRGSAPPPAESGTATPRSTHRATPVARPRRRAAGH
jgi:signal transduction histidine kinase